MGKKRLVSLDGSNEKASKLLGEWLREIQGEKEQEESNNTKGSKKNEDKQEG